MCLICIMLETMTHCLENATRITKCSVQPVTMYIGLEYNLLMI